MELQGGLLGLRLHGSLARPLQGHGTKEAGGTQGSPAAPLNVLTGKPQITVMLPSNLNQKSKSEAGRQEAWLGDWKMPHWKMLPSFSWALSEILRKAGVRREYLRK